MKFINASKNGNKIALLFKVWLGKNTSGIKQTDMSIRFIDGVSDNNAVNELFRYISTRAEDKDINR